MNRENMVEVELDIFSGRPNPHWTLGSEQADKLQSQLRELVPVRELVPTELPEPPGLGYRGFVITNIGQGSGIPRRIRVYNSVATVLEPEKEAYYRGAEEIEKILLEDARRLGYGEVIEAFRIPPAGSE